MSKSAAWYRYLRFWGPDREADLDDELRFHLDSRIQDFMNEGMSEQDARDAALARFGDVERARQRCSEIDRRWAREQDHAQVIDAMRGDVRFATRSLRRAPGFTFAAVLTLALGIGATVALVSVVHGVLVRPLPYGDAGRLASIHTRFASLGLLRGVLSEPEFFDVMVARSFASVAASNLNGRDLVGGCATGDCRPERVRVVGATASLWPTLGVAASAGRVFTAEEDRVGRDRVVVLSNTFWQRRYLGDASIIGKSLNIGGIPRTVVGVMPEEFDYRTGDVYVPLAFRPDSLSGRGGHYLQALGRLRPGVTVEAANRELESIALRLRREFPVNYPKNMGFGLGTISLHEALVGEARGGLLVLLGAVGLLLVLACANVASLQLARTEARRREIAVRAAIGAGRGRLVRQLLTESALLGVVGAALGLLVAPVAVNALLALNPGGVPRVKHIALDGVAIGTALGLALATTILFGLAPALRASGASLRMTLADVSGGSSAGARRMRGRRLLVGMQLAICSLVLVGASLLLESFRRLRSVDPGFAGDRAIAVDLSLPAARYADTAQVISAYTDLLERVRALPGVRAAGAVSALPMVGGGTWDVSIEDHPVTPGDPLPTPSVSIATPGYLDAMRIPVRRGRDITASDDERSTLVALINESMAKRLWPGEDALGRRFVVGRADADTVRWLTVVGVVGDVRTWGLAADAPMQYYLPHAQLRLSAQDMFRGMTIVARTAGEPALVAPAIRNAIWSFDPLVAPANVTTLEAMIDKSVASPRFTSVLLATFGGFALLLATIGVYGLLSYSVAQRTREIGIRVALGAARGQLLSMIVSEGIRIAMVGVACGLVAALWATKWLEKLLFNVQRNDPVVLAGVAVTLVLIAAVAALVPARRAAATDPLIAMRAE
jgi:putative ABC transport system permease protein